ncbi:MAG: outer membrane protein assembly factor BamE [Gammaproteobacteria bacterium]|jgi:outer membrane protein assembly factor BamE|nr:outer membrane protein assembly factor BamE [Gammaproteobacteria bacterium]MDB9797055.1 outer membrane protein assembly factor BamE [Pseudomonadales bacterium]MBT3694641.1 outer membrane protein assembly factor BamE [Gammaproteobacteria bacterium]MBT5333468.1 outer membrane protein assembly factor BamE [Gammaproteobacteria bacterium]MBT5681214.1 outer membrane protein assembly factor BamE [Gammaproteobacteria bacterium]|tara:strand:+ start:1658 stop:2188 length:531 start_codon:yes stop_codon:yes gene_type:complete
MHTAYQEKDSSRNQHWSAPTGVVNIRAMKNLMISALSITLLGGCGLSNLKFPDVKIPRVYKIPVQQGNVITQEMVNRLKPGMTRNQVSFVMGDTVLQDPFERNRWVYLYTLEVPDFFNQQLKMVLDFEDDLLTTISGDLAPIAEAAEQSTETDAQASLSDEDESNTDEPSEEASGE